MFIYSNLFFFFYIKIDCGLSWVAQSTEELLLLSQRLSKPFLTFPAGCKRGSAPTCPGSRRQLCSTEHRADPNPDQSSSATNNHTYSKCEFLVSSYCDFQVAALFFLHPLRLSNTVSEIKHDFFSRPCQWTITATRFLQIAWLQRLAGCLAGLPFLW